MAYHFLSDNFKAFFANINPDPSKISLVAAEHARVTALIEDQSGPAGELSPKCFLQGSYKQQTAIHDINDVDLVALCSLWQPAGSFSGVGRTWSRDEIFETIARSIRRSPRFANAVEYNSGSMCVKINGDVKIEVLPVVYAAGNDDDTKEPFRLYRPQLNTWDNGFARYHQGWLTKKNQTENTNGNFIPAIKVLKHVRTRFSQHVVSFHIECLLYSLPNSLFLGAPADYLFNLFSHIAATPAEVWYRRIIKTPCDDRDIFTSTEWTYESWKLFHDLVTKIAAALASAVSTNDKEAAIKTWQLVLDEGMFPHL